MTTQELKAKAYDTLVQIQALQQQLEAINREIARLSTQPIDEKPAPEKE